MVYKEQKEFSEKINISSNIKDNKNTIISKFDLKDILFILIAGIVGISMLSVLLVVFSIRNMFLIFIILALIEVPIVTLGFLKIHNIPVLDYIKMRIKSDNSQYRKQILKKRKIKADKYILTICFDFTRLEKIIRELYLFIPYKYLELKVLFGQTYLTLEVDNISKVLYDKLFDYLRLNRDIKYISNEDIKNYDMYIGSLKFINRKYAKTHNKVILELKLKLNKLKKVDELKDRYDYLTNRIVDLKANEYIKVYKFLLYKSPFDITMFEELKEFCNITSYITIVDIYDVQNISLTNFSFVDTFLDVIGNLEEIESNALKINEVLKKYHVLFKEINEEKVKDSLLFLMENRY